MSNLTVPAWVQRIVIGLMLILLVSGAVAEVGERWVGVLLGLALAVILVSWLVSARSSSDGATEPGATGDDGGGESVDSDGNSVWNAIPSRQYTGRHVESGGLARDDQEKALAEIEEEARKQAPEEFRD
ncbi:hypothetical protein [Halostagnicola sp. A-GB9-2]|uniref:hypothetical protein n=1 Tax=Halostagnicola sp. A-GB9-2 TaxID=3048066 RepID=UPI0024C09F3F|nr:hypothetical protein [Halostagnicola sp. A-GB9-2]MDJ1432681.1 hypothetical protein [Halostagnicola sp. A-GB9-2]